VFDSFQSHSIDFRQVGSKELARRHVCVDVSRTAFNHPGSRKHNFASTVWNHNLAGTARLWSDRQRSLDALQWGLIPYWAKDPKIAYRTINARAESVDKAPSYRQAFKKRRCLIPADGFYEWRETAKPKLPFAIAMKDGRPFTFAGLWENWKDPESGEWLRTCTIITGEPNELVAQIHPRMPVILPEQHYAAWLGETFHLVTKPADFTGAELVCGE
jgi:putative SOS response-associated peptidase YedK